MLFTIFLHFCIPSYLLYFGSHNRLAILRHHRDHTLRADRGAKTTAKTTIGIHVRDTVPNADRIRRTSFFLLKLENSGPATVNFIKIFGYCLCVVSIVRQTIVYRPVNVKQILRFRCGKRMQSLDSCPSAQQIDAFSSQLPRT